jgi:HSP20 family protein
MLHDTFLDLFAPRTSQDWQPEANVTETSTQYRVDVDLPGIARDKVEVSTDDGVLSIAGERALPEDKRLRVESRFGRFQRKFRLPDGILDQEIIANHRDGLLSVTIPKAQSSGIRTIQIAD